MPKGQKGTSNPAYKHGHTNGRVFSPTYHSWASMIVRCSNPKRKMWKHYGGRGIEVCQRWAVSFEAFLADMGERPEGMSLDRIDNDVGYCKDNCRWADKVTQARNSAQVVWVVVNGQRKRLVEWCEDFGISINTVRDRVKYKGFTYEGAILKALSSLCKKEKKQ